MIKRILILLFTLTWMLFIFRLSDKPAIRSFAQSDKASSVFFQILIPHFEEMDPNEQLKYINAIRNPIRKAAHFTEFAILGILVCESIILWFNFDRRKVLFIAILIGIFYAATDEFHQLFVSGRSGKFTDVIVDAAGVIAGALIIIRINYRRF